VEPTRVLVFASPAGFEHFALELSEPARDDTPPAGLAVPGPEVLGPGRRALWHRGGRTAGPGPLTAPTSGGCCARGPAIRQALSRPSARRSGRPARGARRFLWGRGWW
jgi:hypothetical protein